MKATTFKTSAIGRIELSFREMANTIGRSCWERISNVHSLHVKF